MQPFSARVLVFVAVGSVSGCEFEPDSVAPGYYGASQAGSLAATGSTVSPQGNTGTTSSNTSTAGAASPTPTPSNSAGTPSATASGGAGAPVQPSSGTSAAAGSAAPIAMAPPSAPNTVCSLTGRWIATMHLVADALGELQYTHYFHYLEIDQQGDAFTVKKGLLCGFDSIGLGDFAATANFRSAWASTSAKVKFDGWTGTSVKATGGCQIDSKKWYTARGVTLPHYLDPAVPLPTAEQKASGTTPGWEDWDNDGNPGITGMISGIVSGKIFVAPRLWTSFSGTAADVTSVFKVPTQWNQEQNVMSYDGTPLLGSESVRAADAKLHFTQLARLGADQATGDDAAICKSVIELAPKLTPEGAGN